VKLLAFDGGCRSSDITDAMICSDASFESPFFGRWRGVVDDLETGSPDDLYKDGLERFRFLPFIELIKEKMKGLSLASPRTTRQDRLAGTKFIISHPRQS